MIMDDGLDHNPHPSKGVLQPQEFWINIFNETENRKWYLVIIYNTYSVPFHKNASTFGGTI